MSESVGHPFTGILHSTNASAGAVVPLFLDGSASAYTLKANEYVEVQDVEFVAAAGGDIFLHFKTTAGNSPATGKTIARGTVAANGGIVTSRGLAAVGDLQEQVIAVAPAGVVDVILKGTVREGRTEVLDGRPSWREADKGR